MPQTKADHDTRVRVVKLITEQFPKIGWRVCIEQARPGPETGHYNHKPKWRNDGHGAGQPFRDREPILAFRDVAIEIALNWKGGYTAAMICDLIQNFHGWSQEHQTKMWALIKPWSVEKASDADRAEVREKIE